MLKRMDASGLVEHVALSGVRLTPDGRHLALGVIRRHRLIELFLATSLDIPWEDVHRYADALEHAVDDELVELIAAKLGDPVADPTATRSRIARSRSTTHAADDCGPRAGERARIARVSDSDPAMLKYLTSRGSGSATVRADRANRLTAPVTSWSVSGTHSLGIKLAQAIVEAVA